MRRRLLAVLLASLALLAPLAPTPAQILNSERIEQRFGSYGIDVVYSDAGLRVSNLYSVHDGLRITRSLAMVAYPAQVDAAIAAEHAAILAGASIGASLQAAGWEVVKTGHQYFGFRLDDRIAQAMQVEAGTLVAVHAYQLAIARGAQQFEYVQIIEIHHPDYLDLAALPGIYGEAVVSGVSAATGRLLRDGLAQLEREGLALSE